jgi:histidyl-tRNA synthetase
MKAHTKGIRRDLRHKLLEKAVEVAGYYGFKYAGNTLDGTTEPTSKKPASSLALTPVRKCAPLDRDGRHVSVMEAYIEKSSADPDDSLMVFYHRLMPLPRAKTPAKRQMWLAQFVLEIFGMQASIAEAILLRTILAILAEVGFSDIIIDINSVGDLESISKFSKECSAYYRRHLASLHPQCREMLKKDIWGVLACRSEKCRAIKEGAPRPISFLSEQSRKHLKEVLEYLEIMNVQYRINDLLAPGGIYYSETLFELLMSDIALELEEDSPASTRVIDRQPLAYGGRYNLLAQRMWHRKNIPAIGATLPLGIMRTGRLRATNIRKKPQVYLIQLGFEARRRGLLVAEILRKAKIPMLQSPDLDQLGIQLARAEELSIPYTIIMGHKEAIEETVIVRHTDTRSQETVAVTALPAYLKKLR